ncbi:plasmid stabilization protein [Streptomyces apocyni]|uniref:plasmid stabilization protein n=1 Tax=Streptomyces apocyni TaxID=2654677 RepID=UPI0012EA375C|nr:plasmid stabilization protein [Streptomyces apocyni]
MPAGASRKRERQYEKIKQSQLDAGRSERKAERIAAATVNKERARSGEAESSSKLSQRDISSGRRGGKRSGQGPGGRTKEQLYEEAKRQNIEGRSKMNKAELQREVGD